jgi:hypothetical protein
VISSPSHCNACEELDAQRAAFFATPKRSAVGRAERGVIIERIYKLCKQARLNVGDWIPANLNITMNMARRYRNFQDATPDSEPVALPPSNAELDQLREEFLAIQDGWTLSVTLERGRLIERVYAACKSAGLNTSVWIPAYLVSANTARNYRRVWRNHARLAGAADLQPTAAYDLLGRYANPQALSHVVATISAGQSVSMNHVHSRLTGKPESHYQIKGANARARANNLQASLTEADWEFALDYFHHACAVCGRQLTDLFGDTVAALDHWIPINDSSPDNPGTVATNIVPLCHGFNGCNNSKCDRDAEQWLIERFGKVKAKRISARVNAYFDVVRIRHRFA